MEGDDGVGGTEQVGVGVVGEQRGGKGPTSYCVNANERRLRGKTVPTVLIPKTFVILLKTSKSLWITFTRGTVSSLVCKICLQNNNVCNDSHTQLDACVCV